MEGEQIRWKNEHNIWVNTGLATQKQLEMAVDVFKRKLVQMFPKQNYEACEILVNLVQDSKGNSYKYAYLWVSDPRVYYILAGFNPDGTERFKDEEESSSASKDLDDSFDLDDLNLESEFTSQSKKIKKPVIREPLPPILTLPGYEYTPEQKVKALEELRADYIASGKDVSEIVPPQYGYFKASRAHTGTLDKHEDASILCSYVPNWVTEDMLKKVFFRYSSDKSGMYPKITFTLRKTSGFVPDHKKNTKFVKVEFSRSYHQDAIFALQMTRRIYMRDLPEEKRVKEEAEKAGTAVPEVRPVMMIFEHYRKSDRLEEPRHTSGSGGGSYRSFDKPFRR